MAKKQPRTQVYDLMIRWDYYERHQIHNANAQGCTHWNAGKHKQGYGMVGAIRISDGEDIMVTTHRVAARLKYGRALDSKEMVLHTCSNMACMNPDHLVIGDRADMQDIMVANKRHRYGVAVRVRMPSPRVVASKMTDHDLARVFLMPNEQIQKEFGMSPYRSMYLKRACGTERRVRRLNRLGLE
jgi:hypothetical protein